MLSFIKKEAALCTAGLCALISMAFVPPSPAYFSYIDFRVLCLLFCLMAVVAGFQACGFFIVLAQKLLGGEKKLRRLSLLLVLLPFFSSMFITNDVALITFVPFAILILSIIGRPQYTIWIVVLQTAAANLGSMATPVGNPQNLFLYATYQIPTSSFFKLMLPFALLSLLITSAASLFIPNETLTIRFDSPAKLQNHGKLLLFLGMFLLCLLSVFRILPYGLLTVIVILSLFLWDRKLFLGVDYSLLLTFVCFFVFAGNMGNIPWVKQQLQAVMRVHPLGVSAAASQIISNVPAAVLLSGFTDNWKALLAGSNIGGLGTPIASLASLISLKIYARSPQARPFSYLLTFLAVNAAGLCLLLLTASFLL